MKSLINSNHIWSEIKNKETSIDRNEIETAKNDAEELYANIEDIYFSDVYNDDCAELGGEFDYYFSEYQRLWGKVHGN